MKKSNFRLGLLEKGGVNECLRILYGLEESTKYKCKAISKAIDRLQTLLNDKLHNEKDDV